MLKLYNSLTREIEEVGSVNGNVNMYSCGPTVYYFAHIGNMRAYLFMDQIRRVIKYNGLKINGVINITDVGHLVSDEDTGEDKMLVAAKRENKNPWEIAQFYTDAFFKDIKKLNIDMPATIAKATEHISEMIEFVKALLEKGYAYELDDGIYFSVEKFSFYGQLSKISLDDKKAGARIEVNSKKKHPADFALWIKAPKEHIMQWDSPWGKGYPGWHIECSAMGMKYLGNSIHVHTGGIDHLPVHHENEIAQNNSFCGKPVVKIWSHVAFLQVDGGKMSKSLGNLYLIDDLINKGFSPLDFRFFNFSASYRKGINFTWEALTAAKNGLIKLKSQLALHKTGENNVSDEIIESYKEQFFEAVNNDLNFPLAIGIIFEILKNPPSRQIYDLILDFDRVLGLELNKEDEVIIPEEVQLLLEKRETARKNKDFKESDALRNQINALGYNVLDTSEGQKVNKN